MTHDEYQAIGRRVAGDTEELEYGSSSLEQDDRAALWELCRKLMYAPPITEDSMALLWVGDLGPFQFGDQAEAALLESLGVKE